MQSAAGSRPGGIPGTALFSCFQAYLPEPMP